MTAQVIKLDGAASDREHLQHAAWVLEEGGLVAFPTETVYGIACRIKPEALTRLTAVKGRDAEKHYTLHIGQKDDYRTYVPSTGLRIRKLIQQAWPGPLTLVFELDPIEMSKQKARFDTDVVDALYKNGSIGIRCPDHAAASMLLRLAEGPVVAPSANLAGERPATSAEEVMKHLGELIDLVLDGGPCQHSLSSTVARVGTKGVTLLRQGVYSQADLRRMAQVTILFVCTGNTCRSAMAEGLFRAYLAKKVGCPVDELPSMGYIIASAGTMDIAGTPASDGAMTACGLKGVDITDHASRHLTEPVIEASDVIFGMTRSHCERVCALSPEARNKTFLLAEDFEIPDPVGQPQDCFNRCADIIEAAIKARIGEFIL